MSPIPYYFFLRRITFCIELLCVELLCVELLFGEELLCVELLYIKKYHLIKPFKSECAICLKVNVQC